MKFLLPIAAATALLGCSSLVNDSVQNITILTPGAENARCIIENEDFKYPAWSNQTIQITKSPHDFIVNCKADGNRERTVHVKRDVDEWVAANVANGFVPGAAYDYFSRGAFTYPEKITVSFVGVPKTLLEAPEYSTQFLSERYKPGIKIDETNYNEKYAPLEKLDILYTSDFSSEESAQQNSVNNNGYDPREEDK